jgi:putative flippase GtrA
MKAGPPTTTELVIAERESLATASVPGAVATGEAQTLSRRFVGRLMSPRAQPARWAIVGVLTSLAYLGLTLLGAGVAGLPIEFAMPCAYVPAVLLHFMLQRGFVFRRSEGFALTLHDQARRYVLLGGTQVVLAALITTFLPHWIGVDKRIVYLVATPTLAAIAYLVLRFHVFHGPQRALDADRSR